MSAERKKYLIQRSDGGVVAEFSLELDASLALETQLDNVRKMLHLVMEDLEKEIEGRGAEGGGA